MKQFEEWLEKYNLNRFPGSVNYEDTKSAWRAALEWTLDEFREIYEDEFDNSCIVKDINEELKDE